VSYLYYPGCCCALEATGRAYEESLLAVLARLGVQFPELGDWNCCGATMYMAVDEKRSWALSLRNLALAEKQGGNGPVDWPLKTRCCGGSLTGTVEEVGLRLAYILLREAKQRGADVVVTACPFCECNLECFQKKVRRKYPDLAALPAVFFTQLVGVAMGIPAKELGLHRLLVPLEPALARVHRGGSYAAATA
jgi:heterodisulfide reductase subunit B